MRDLLPELCDSYGAELTLLPSKFSSFGGKAIFWGQVETVRCPEDNGLVRQILSEPGKGRVLLIDGGGGSRRALLGDQLAELALQNGWSGILVYGYVRDVMTLSNLPLGVQALGAMPLKTDKRGLGERSVEVEIEGRRIQPGDYLYADPNGIAISAALLVLPEGFKELNA
ncbi:putative 4-hydroxy-4-methyl-2-oxoglutarate aldolase [Ferrimonas gelatinilytica]|uniref:4-hydroxy-4-methyl-2-oxoglutarate aldolase n=1 Tax=Ferrimonas gelatinilytica TaxID=1255257 RepID=A0ABP9S0N4_9GAMM